MTTPDAHAHSSQAAARARSRALLFGLVALVLASATAFLAWWVVAEYETRLAGVQQDEQGALLVATAAVDLRPGHILGEEDVMLAPRPGDVDLGSVFFDLSALVGETVGERVLEGEAIRRERLASGGSELRMDEIIEPGSRAITIKTVHEAAVGGLLLPGYFVDVIVTVQPQTKELAANWATETILQGVRVLATGDAVATTRSLVEEEVRAQEGRPREIFVTLEVDPEEAEQLALASTRGRLHLSLRAQDDFMLVESDGPLVTNALVGLSAVSDDVQENRLDRKKAIRRRAAPRQKTQVTEGDRTRVEEFDEEGSHIQTTNRR